MFVDVCISSGQIFLTFTRFYLVMMVAILMKSLFEYVCKLPPGKKIPSEMEVAPR